MADFDRFFGNREGAIKSYWTFLCCHYVSPVAPRLRQAAIVNSVTRRLIQCSASFRVGPTRPVVVLGNGGQYDVRAGLEAAKRRFIYC
jgi:hypothetical protein